MSTLAEKKNHPGSRLLVIEPARSLVSHSETSALPSRLAPGDLFVVNAAATLPASFQGRHRPSGREVELRLAVNLSPSLASPSHWRAVLFGEGDWRTPTEHRAAPPEVHPGELLELGHGLMARIGAVDPASPRLVTLRFLGTEDAIWALLYRAGKPIQYSYARRELELWERQTLFSGPPVAVEPPSAAYALSWETLEQLRARGIEVRALIHGAGISSTGDAALDARLPLDEPYVIPDETARAVNLALREGRRIFAAGTSVTRALESADEVRAGYAVTSLRLSASHRRRVVSGILTGLHEAGASHLQLLESFAPRQLIERAYGEAADRGYQWHEYGDSCLIVGTEVSRDLSPATYPKSLINYASRDRP